MREKKGKIYSRLAVTGMMKNYRIYVPYLLACIGMIMMYYILNFLMKSKDIASIKGGNSLQQMLSLGSGVFIVFSVIFLFYTNSFLIRSRKREFGLYNILGMGKKNLARILVWENGTVAAISLAGGIFCGILFSKLAELWLGYVLEGTVTMSFTIDTRAVWESVKLFLLIFLLLLCNALFQVGKAKPIDLLHSAEVGEKPPKGNWFLAIVGFGMLGAAYFIAVSIEDPMSAFMMFFIAVGMVIVATYLIFVAGSVLMCRVLQKNKTYYYRANHFISVSSMVYRMKRNGAGLASICVLSTMVLVMLSATSSLYFGNEARLMGRYPREIELYAYTSDEAQQQKISDTVDEILTRNQMEQENVLEYRYMSVGGYFEGNQVYLNQEKLNQNFGMMDISKIRDIYLIPLEDYNRLMGQAESLNENEVILYTANAAYDYATLTLEECDTWNVKKTVDRFIDNGDAMSTILDSLFVFVPDKSYLDRFAEIGEEKFNESGVAMTWYYGFDLPADEEVQQQIAAEISDGIDQAFGENEKMPRIRRECRASEKADFYALFSGLFVLGILLAIVFLAATVLIMYYKQISEGLEDQSRFDIMQKVGMTDREIRSSIHSQMLTVFLLPLLLAGLHTCFAFPIVQKLLLVFGIMESRVLLYTNLICFAVFGVFYAVVYLITSRSYYRIVRGIRR